jgi:anaerobic magnesium-protoporphyrin IX monomethyl ester cyclase
MNNLDVLFVSPGGSKFVYQGLANKISAIEPPTWALLLAQSCRSIDYKVAILDMNAENLTLEEGVERIKEHNPRLICFVVYGQNVNSGTVSMTGATMFSEFIKNSGVTTPIAYIGSYVQALPKKALLEESSIDIAFMNEGVYAVRNLLSKEIDLSNLDHVNGIAWRKNGEVVFNEPEKVVPTERMDIDLPGYAWDLLPFKDRPLDLYRSPLWHAEYDENKRSPYAALQTSLGCRFGCSFCMINTINRNDNAEIGVSSNYSNMRFWSPEFIIKEFDKLVEMGIETIRIVDEMFLLNKKYYVPLCTMLKERGYGDKVRMWAYSRVDTVTNPETLKLVREAGIKWLCLGIESSEKKVRLEVSKGKFEDVDIVKVVKQVEEAGIDVLANYIFGLPGEDLVTMQSTLDLSLELNTAGWNAYPAIALPGSQLYKDSFDNGYNLPTSYDQYGFHAKKTLPMYNEKLTRKEILEFRDQAFIKYHSNENFLNMIESKFGTNAKENILKSLEIKLERE